MYLKDATRFFGRVGLFLPLTLIFLTAADSALACPGHKTGAVYRTRTANTKVIAYRAPAAYQRCGANLYDTRRVKYAAARGSNHYNAGGTRYVAVRNGDSYAKLKRVRYVAMRNDDAPRYVAVRRVSAPVTRYVEVREYPRIRFVPVRDVAVREQVVAIRHQYPIHRISDTKYAEVRSGYRNKNGVVRYINLEDDSTRYVAVRRPVATKYVAVRDIDDDDTRFVAVRKVNNGCARVVRCVDDVEARSTKHVVLRDVALRDEIDDDDDEYVEVPAKTKYVALEDDSDEPEEFVKLRRDDVSTSDYIESGSAFYDNDGDTYVAVKPAAAITKTVSYVPVTDDDDEEMAILDDSDTTYVVAADVEDACLSRMSIDDSPAIARTRTVSYVPVDDVDNDSTYVVMDNSAASTRYVAVSDDDDDIVEAETVSYVPVDDVEEVDTGTVSYVPVADTTVETMSYVPVADVEEIDAKAVSYVQVADVDDVDETETVSYVPASNVSYVRTTDIDACEIDVSNVEVEPIEVADNSTVLVSEVDSGLVTESSGTEQIAARFGYRDGFEDGRDAALERDVYHPENSGDFQKATNGYEDTFGDKDVYKSAYRDSYLDGYLAGFESSGRAA